MAYKTILVHCDASPKAASAVSRTRDAERGSDGLDMALGLRSAGDACWCASAGEKFPDRQPPGSTRASAMRFATLTASYGARGR